MALAVGTRLGPYEVLGLIGAGGMGEVYKARDTRLDRVVAVKVLPAELSTDPERQARFEREARAIAALAHPHICTLHDVGIHGSSAFLVLEHLEGETLADRLRKGPLPLVQALAVATQVADALDAAHKHGIVHRDLKPGNVMLTGSAGRSGTLHAKLLDFGLAQLKGHGDRPGFAGGQSVPTQSEPLTGRGTILGTLHYMAPEQLEGREADARADLWALGAILYEMLTGRRAFDGASQASLIGNIMNAEPPALATLQPLTPPTLERLVRRCLAKHPDDRWDTAHDVADELRWIAEAGSTSTTAPPARHSRWRNIGLVTALVVIIAATGTAVWNLRPMPPPSRPVIRMDLALPVDVQVYGASAPIVSPDGNRVVFGGVLGRTQQLYLRQLDRFEVTPLPGTAPMAERCFFSPDGRAVAFFSMDASLKRVTLADGLVVTLAREVDFARGGTWGANGRITFVRRGELWQVPADGGSAVRLTALDSGKVEVSHEWPHAVREGEVILFASVDGGGSGMAHIEALSVSTGERRVLVESGTFPLYASSGHLVYVRDGALLAAPFDLELLRVSGTSVRVLEDVPVDHHGSPLVSLSNAGSLVYPALGNAASRLVWVSRQGLEQPISDTPRRYMFPRLSPDGRRVVVTDAGALWLSDLGRRTLARLTADGSAAHSWPVWTPDGRRVVFQTPTGLRWLDVDSGGRSEQIPDTSVADYPTSVSPDGNTLAFLRFTNDRAGDIYALSLRGEPKPFAVVSTPAHEGGGRFSPDGRWLAYVSTETGQMEVFLRPFPGPARRWQVSSEGGTHPVWSRNGRELLYRNGDKMMAVDVDVDSEPMLSQPRILFEQRYAFGIGTTIPNHDCSPDGERCVMVKDESGSRGLSLVLNWFEELKTRVPTEK